MFGTGPCLKGRSRLFRRQTDVHRSLDCLPGLPVSKRVSLALPRATNTAVLNSRRQFVSATDESHCLSTASHWAEAEKPLQANVGYRTRRMVEPESESRTQDADG